MTATSFTEKATLQVGLQLLSSRKRITLQMLLK